MHIFIKFENPNPDHEIFFERAEVNLGELGYTFKPYSTKDARIWHFKSQDNSLPLTVTVDPSDEEESAVTHEDGEEYFNEDFSENQESMFPEDYYYEDSEDPERMDFLNSLIELKNFSGKMDDKKNAIISYLLEYLGDDEIINVVFELLSDSKDEI